jgi:hypothetical protein
VRRAALLSLALALPAVAQDIDEQRAAWSHARSVTPPPQTGAFASLTLPPELLARSRADLADLRLVAPDGQELSWVIDRARPRDVQARFSGRLVDVRREQKRWSAWTLEFEQQRDFDTLLLQIPERDFAKAVRVETSDDRVKWREVLREAGVFDRPWGASSLHHARVELKAPERARYLRLTMDDTRSRAVNVTGVEAMSVKAQAGESWTRSARVRPLLPSRGTSRYALEDVAGLPFERLRIDAADAAFSRRVRVLEVKSRNGRNEETVLGEGELYRVRVEDAALAAEALALDVRAPTGGELVLEVRDDDSPPLRGLRVTVEAAATRLLFVAQPGPLSLYYGNPLTRPARYDLETQRNRIAAAAPFATAQLGPERANPRFRAPVPLAFTPVRGAALEPQRWSSQRPFAVPQREDLYSLTLAATDLASLRPDLADLRVVDEHSRQVPFLVETGAATQRVELRVESERIKSRHRIEMPKRDGAPVALPVTTLELDVPAGFFSRPLRVLDPSVEDRGGAGRVVAATTLARSGREEGSRAPLEVALDGGRYAELLLQLDEGDDAPLRIDAARAVVRVPRLVFKAGPGRYRLLLGNRDATPARYDIASLRHEFLNYSAVPLEAEPLATNPERRRRFADYWSDAPPTLVLWGTLLLAVVALLALTARVLGQEAPPPKP